MAQQPADNNPFGEIEADALERMPQPKTAKQALGAVLAFLLMGVGGLLLVDTRDARRPKARSRAEGPSGRSS